MMRRYLVAAFFVLLAVYVLFQARFIILGPGVAVTYPKDGSSVPSGVITLRGTARNASFLTLNGRRIYTNTSGYFEEKLIASPGINIMELTVRDRFGREAEKVVRVMAN